MNYDIVKTQLENEFGKKKHTHKKKKKRFLFCKCMLYHLYLYSPSLYRAQISLIYIESEVARFHQNF